MDRERVDAFLASVDGALRDDPISGDAMHWVPPQDRGEYDEAHTWVPPAGAEIWPVGLVLNLDTTAVEESMRRLGDVMKRCVERLARDSEVPLTLLRLRLADAQILGAVPLVESPERTRPGDDITDPRERALFLRRTRNTGPAQRQRAPRRIDARRGRG